jgi:hypothetical protein
VAAAAGTWPLEQLFWRVAGPLVSDGAPGLGDDSRAAADTTDTGEQSLVARLVRDHPELFAGRVFLMDRNFLGYHLITAILDAGGP